MKQFTYLVPQYKKPSNESFLYWGTTGNRTQIEGSTNLSVNRYTIIPMNIATLCNIFYSNIYHKEFPRLTKRVSPDAVRHRWYQNPLFVNTGVRELIYLFLNREMFVK